MIRIWQWRKVYSRGSGFNLDPSRVRVDGVDKASTGTVDIWIDGGEEGKIRAILSHAQAHSWAMDLLKATGWKMEKV